MVEFDERRGVGVVLDESTLADDQEGSGLSFHCTAIVDGSRTIECGQDVVYELRAAAAGLWEAATVRPLPGATAGARTVPE